MACSQLSWLRASAITDFQKIVLNRVSVPFWAASLCFLISQQSMGIAVILCGISHTVAEWSHFMLKWPKWQRNLLWSKAEVHCVKTIRFQKWFAKIHFFIVLEHRDNGICGAGPRTRVSKAGQEGILESKRKEFTLEWIPLGWRAHSCPGVSCLPPYSPRISPLPREGTFLIWLGWI